MTRLGPAPAHSSAMSVPSFDGMWSTGRVCAAASVMLAGAKPWQKMTAATQLSHCRRFTVRPPVESLLNYVCLFEGRARGSWNLVKRRLFLDAHDRALGVEADVLRVTVHDELRFVELLSAFIFDREPFDRHSFALLLDGSLHGRRQLL